MNHKMPMSKIDCCPKCRSIEISTNVSTNEIYCPKCKYEGKTDAYKELEEFQEELDDQMDIQKGLDNQTFFL